ncbi:MAG: DUF72 domain-containing protein [Polyangiaceae bacterium]|nr:DUF72 domain-containing protein [Polyangiaceae bacterium]
MARLLVGLPQLQGKLKNYASRYDMVELRPVDEALPPPGRLKRWRADAPPGFAFSVVLPRVVASLEPGPAADEALETTLRSAAALEARCILLATPPSVRPTQRNRNRIVELAHRLPETGVVLCWQPSGIWEIEDAAAVAHLARLLLVLDGSRDPLPPGPIAYTRLKGLGESSQLGSTSLTRLADQLAGRRECFVVVESGDAARVKSSLLALLEGRPMRAAGAVLFRPGQEPKLVGIDEEQ